MDTPSVPQKRCSRKSLCIHPEAVDGWLPATAVYFHTNKRRSDGLCTKCKECANADTRQWHLEHLEYAREKARQYHRDHHEERLAYLRQYSKEHAEVARKRTRAHYWSHREHHITMEHDRYYRNKERDFEKHRIQLRRWRHAHPDQARAQVALRRSRLHGAEGAYTESDIRLLYRSQRGLCWWCGAELNNVYHIDHRIPLVQGGSNSPDNLVLSCPQCNLSKGGKLPQEWSGRLL